MYQVGQAVINPNGALIISNGNGWEQIDGSDYLMIGVKPKRPATEDEILSEIQKQGWNKSKYNDWQYYSPKKHIVLSEVDKWQPSIKREPLSDQYAVFGNECIQAHRIITALNLAK